MAPLAHMNMNGRKKRVIDDNDDDEPASTPLPPSSLTSTTETSTQKKQMAEWPLSTLPGFSAKRLRPAAGGIADGSGLSLTVELHPNGITDVHGNTDNAGCREMLLKPLKFEPIKLDTSKFVWRHTMATPADDPTHELMRRGQKDGVQITVVDCGRALANKPKLSARELFAKTGGVIAPPAECAQPPQSTPPARSLLVDPMDPAGATGRTHISAIRSGGQAGADRAALDWALAHGVPAIGWCPCGRKAEDGFLSPQRYSGVRPPLAERPHWTSRLSSAVGKHTRPHTRPHTHTRTAHTHIRACARAHTNTRAHARAHVRAHIFLIANPADQLLRLPSASSCQAS